nr:MAG TPA: helix-turn-helix domain-containing protein [Caudoviricetes sp.]
MTEIMLSVRPKWCELIASGKRTIEQRKTKPNCDVPFKVYIYCTRPIKKYQTVCRCMILNVMSCLGCRQVKSSTATAWK